MGTFGARAEFGSIAEAMSVRDSLTCGAWKRSQGRVVGSPGRFCMRKWHTTLTSTQCSYETGRDATMPKSHLSPYIKSDME